MSTSTPNMGLLISTIGTDSGLSWEQNLNASLLTIDNHNHTAGNGAPIPFSAISVTSNLSVANFALTNVQAVEFTSQSSFTTVSSIYVSTAGDLWYNNGGGTGVQITTGTTVNATSSGISSGTASAAFSAGVLVVNAATNTPGNVQCGSVLLGNNSANSKFLTLAPPSAMAANITQTLPTIPGAQSFMAIDASGNMSGYAAVSAGITGTMIAGLTITASNIAAATITGAKIASATITGSNIAGSTIAGSNIASATVAPANLTASNVVASSSGSLTTSSTSLVFVTNVAVTMSNLVTNRPVFLFFQGGPITGTNGGGIAFTVNFVIRAYNGVSYTNLVTHTVGVSASGTINFPAGSLNCVDTSGGSVGNQYSLWVNVANVAQSLTLTNIILVGMQ